METQSFKISIKTISIFLFISVFQTFNPCKGQERNPWYNHYLTFTVQNGKNSFTVNSKSYTCERNTMSSIQIYKRGLFEPTKADGTGFTLVSKIITDSTQYKGFEVRFLMLVKKIIPCKLRLNGTTKFDDEMFFNQNIFYETFTIFYAPFLNEPSPKVYKEIRKIVKKEDQYLEITKVDLIERTMSGKYKFSIILSDETPFKVEGDFQNVSFQ